MSVTNDDVRHIAALARLGVADERLPALVGELNRILDHMAVLSKVGTTGVSSATGVGDTGTPLRADQGPAYPLERALDAFAPSVRDGFLLVPRLATHEGLDSVADDAGNDYAGDEEDAS